MGSQLGSDSEKRQELGRRLREFAETQYDSIAGLERALGMHPKSLGRYTRGAHLPGASLLSQLVRLGLSLDWLFAGTGKMLIQETHPSTETPNEAELQYLGKLPPDLMLRKVGEIIQRYQQESDDDSSQ